MVCVNTGCALTGVHVKKGFEDVFRAHKSQHFSKYLVTVMCAVCISRCPGMDLTHTDWGERTKISFKEQEKVREEDGVGGKHTNHSDRDSLPTVAHSIQYSWKCDTFPLQ